MIEVAPHSLFGKHNYAKEQILIMEAMKSIDQSVMLISPLTEIVPVPLQYLPADWRRTKIKSKLENARKLLNELM